MLNCAAPTKFSRMRLSFSQKTGRSKAGTAAIQCPRPVPCSKGQRVRVLPLPSDAGPAAALAASSGPDTEDLRRKSGQPELRCGADSAGIGAAGRKNQPLRRAMKKGGLLKSPARRPQSLTKADVAAHLSHSTFLFINRINDMNMPRFHGNSSIASVIFFATKQASYCYRPFGYLGRSLRGSVN